MSVCPVVRLNAPPTSARCCSRTSESVQMLTDAFFFFPPPLTAVINGERRWPCTKLLLNSLTFCVIASGQFAEEVRGSNGIRLEKYNYRFTYKWNNLLALREGEQRFVGTPTSIRDPYVCLQIKACEILYVHLRASTFFRWCKKRRTYEWLKVVTPPPVLLRFPVYHGGSPWQPQKWPVRTLGNVDVQIMTC